MTAELQFLEAWIPEKMEPGTVFLLEGPNSLGHGNNPFVAVLACPGCGTVGLITRRQLHGFETMICVEVEVFCGNLDSMARISRYRAAQ